MGRGKRQLRRRKRLQARKRQAQAQRQAKAPAQIVRGVGKALNPLTVPSRIFRGARTLLGQGD